MPDVVPDDGAVQSLEVALDEDAAVAEEAATDAEAADTGEAPDAAAAAAASGRRRGGGDTIFWMSPTRCAVNGLFDPSDCARLYDSLASRRYRSPRFSYASA